LLAIFLDISPIYFTFPHLRFSHHAEISKAAAAKIAEPASGSSTHSSFHGDGAASEFSHVPGYSSGASTPVDSRSLDGSNHEPRDRSMSGNPKSLAHSNSVLGLDNMIEARKEEGDLMNNMVHIEVRYKACPLFFMSCYYGVIANMLGFFLGSLWQADRGSL